MQRAVSLAECSDLDPDTAQRLQALIWGNAKLMVDVFGPKTLAPDEFEAAEDLLQHFHDALDGR